MAARGGGGGGGGGERKGPENTQVYTQEELGLALSQSVKIQEKPSSLEGGGSAMDCTVLSTPCVAPRFYKLTPILHG